jgi:hypothetical protein
MTISSLNTRVEKYAAGKIWYWYLPLWLFGLYIFYELFQLDMAHQQMPLVLIIPYSADFLLHEWAHIFTAFLPAVMTASAGSLSELGLGTTLVVMAFWQRSYFAALFCLLWLDLACQSAGQYMADAIPQQLQLVSLGAALSGGEAKHDWHFVFGQLHILQASYFIGDSIRIIGDLAGLLGVAFSAWLLYKMSQAPRWASSNDEAVLIATHSPIEEQPNKPSEDKGFTSLPFDDHIRK